MPAPHAREYVVECFWPGVQDGDLEELDARIAAVAGAGVRYQGSILMRADEVVLCLFAGSEDDVRAVAKRASIPFERILESVRSPWPNAVSP
jgi:hypothetical protein